MPTYYKSYDGNFEEVEDNYFEKAQLEASDKQKELEFVCKMLNHKDKHKVVKWLKNNMDITSIQSNKETKNKLYFDVMTFLIKFDNHKVDGKIWNNGCFGSRWSDKVKDCRLAFYSRKLDKKMFEDAPHITKEYLIIVMED